MRKGYGILLGLLMLCGSSVFGQIINSPQIPEVGQAVVFELITEVLEEGDEVVWIIESEFHKGMSISIDSFADEGLKTVRCELKRNGETVFTQSHEVIVVIRDVVNDDLAKKSDDIVNFISVKSTSDAITVKGATLGNHILVTNLSGQTLFDGIKMDDNNEMLIPMLGGNGQGEFVIVSVFDNRRLVHSSTVLR